MTSLKCKHGDNSSGSNQEKRSQCERSQRVHAHRQESKSTLWVQRAHFNSPLCAQHLPPSVFKVALYCPLLSTGLTCFSLDRPSSTYSTPAWPSITALFSLRICLSLPCFFFFLSFSYFNHIFHCSLLTKTPPTASPAGPPLTPSLAQGSSLLPRLRRRSSNWTAVDSHSVNFAAVVDIHNGTRTACVLRRISFCLVFVLPNKHCVVIYLLFYRDVTISKSHRMIIPLDLRYLLQYY